MKNFILLAVMMLVSEAAKSACISPISRTNFSPLTVLTSTKLNSDLNNLYTQINELPGDCITDETVTGAKIVNGTIETEDIADKAITYSKLSNANYVISASSGGYGAPGTTFTDVTNLTATITTAGRPVEIFLVGGSIGMSYMGDGAGGELKIVRETTDLYTIPFGLTVTGSTTGVVLDYPSSSVRYMDTPAAGNYVYKVQARVIGGGIFTVSNVKLVVREL